VECVIHTLKWKPIGRGEAPRFNSSEIFHEGVREGDVRLRDVTSTF